LKHAEPDQRVILDRKRPLQDAQDVGHTRWHPDIPPIARITRGEVIEIDVRDGGDVQIDWTTTMDDFASYDLDRLHPLTGPFHVADVEPGDLLEVEILDVIPPDFAWSRVAPGGGGLMRGSVHDPLLIKWKLGDGVARSDDLPGVTIKGAPFIGTIGVAPSGGQLTAINERETALRDEGGWALAPSAKNALPQTPDVVERGLRTLPPREFGGNMDIKDVCAGCRVVFTANVPGALLSIGDLHFAQGDGESFGTAIEMGGTAKFRCNVVKAAERKWRPRGPYLETSTGSLARDGRRYLVTTGTSVDQSGRNEYMGIELAAQNALNDMVRYLVEERGYSRAQGHCIVSIAGDLRINVVNNPPNPVVSVALPLDIFDDES
jgi:formamidase